jgi:protein-S-isoprenylcysteine O-methyltransferase Ste14
MLKTKIPPPIIALLFIIVTYLSSLVIAPFKFSNQSLMSCLIFLLGLVCVLSAMRQFKQKNTIINPMTPQKTTTLVVDGIFNYSRNPMYLGLLLVLTSSGIYFGAWLSLLLVPIFYFLITTLQIIPEEEAMLELFGESFVEYTKKVRRWI